MSQAIYDKLNTSSAQNVRVPATIARVTNSRGQDRAERP